MNDLSNPRNTPVKGDIGVWRPWWDTLRIGSEGQMLTVGSDGLPAWGYSPPSFFFGTGAFLLAAGTPAHAVVGTTAPAPAWAFDGASFEIIAMNWRVPASWVGAAISAELYWSASTTDAGNVRWVVTFGSIAEGDQVDESSATTLADNIAVSGVVEQLQIDTLPSTHTAAAGAMLRVRVGREGDAGADTYDAHDAYFHGLRLVAA